MSVAQDIASNTFWSVETEANIHADMTTWPLSQMILAASISELAIGKLRAAIAERIGVTSV
jgi:hypothetical protein